VKIDVYHSETCGSYYSLKENLDRALEELAVRAEVLFHAVYYEDTISLGIKGSPSIWIDGKDAFEGGNSPGLT
jgi:predicted thioredoxin/glutaredoxin